MALYLVGDIQGCLDELKALLNKVQFNPENDKLWLVGDLVARGPNSLETLRFLKSMGTSVNFVLGNHDLHLLAIHAGIKSAKKSDKLDELLQAPDIDELIDWLAQHPLLLELPKKAGLVTHAGIAPQWNFAQAIKCARFAEKKLAGKKRNKWLSLMYGDSPNHWSKVTTNEEKFRFTINALTRMRYVYADGSLDFKCKDKPNSTSSELMPWFEQIKLAKKQHIVFGHWAALMGHVSSDNIFALDTGCVWGNYMTLMRWKDKKLYTQVNLSN